MAEPSPQAVRTIFAGPSQVKRGAARHKCSRTIDGAALTLRSGRKKLRGKIGDLDMLTTRAHLPATASLLAMVLAGCSSGIAGLSTGSTANTSPPVPTAPVVVKPADRALQVAATSARAGKCGYNFDPGRLRSGYIASEVQAGLAPAETATLEKLYDATRTRVAASITDAEEFCSDEQTAVIKSDLKRHMAGDFSVSRAPDRTAASWWQSGANKPWNSDETFYPRGSRY